MAPTKCSLRVCHLAHLALALLGCHHFSVITRGPIQLAHAFATPASLRLRANDRSCRSTINRCDASPSGSEGTSAVSAAASSTQRRVSSATISHHIAIKTRNIENAIKFYSLLGFEVESKFVAGPARAAWLLHESSDENDGNNNPQSRIELLEVPSYMLDEPEGTVRRAIDLTKREELLGLNHLALDVTANIPRPDNDGGASEEGTACALYQLQEWMDDLNALSVEKFGKTLRVALPPTKRIVGREVYEMAFLYDADGALVELLNHSGTLGQEEMADGWEPWDGKGFVR